MQTNIRHISRFASHLMATALAAVMMVACSADNGAPGGILTIGGFTATPSTVAPGGTTTLSYTTVGAVSCTASSTAPGSSWMGSVPTSGNTSVTVPTTPGNYIYTLTCANAAGDQTTQTETVRVPAPAGTVPVISVFTATPTSVAPGGSTVLTYNTSGAETCAASSSAPGSTWMGSVPTSSTGTTVVTPLTPGNYTYALTCTSATGQQTTQFAVVTVNGSGTTNDGTPTGGGPGSPLPNDGTPPTGVFDGGNPIPGNFICTATSRAYGPNPITAVRVNGLVGSPLTNLLNLLGAGTVTQLQNSVIGKELAVDGNLDTAAQYNLSVGLLGGAISSIDLFAGLNGTAPIGKYAVFGVTFPIATAELSLIQSITVNTFLGDTLQETQDIDASTLDLVGAVSTGDTVRYVGLKATKPYNGVTISLSPTLVSANVGNAMNVHELCTDGFFVPAP